MYYLFSLINNKLVFQIRNIVNKFELIVIKLVYLLKADIYLITSYRLIFVEPFFICSIRKQYFFINLFYSMQHQILNTFFLKSIN